MEKNALLLILGLLVTIAGVIQASKRGVSWVVLFLIFWVLLFAYSWQRRRLRARSGTQEGDLSLPFRITDPDGLSSVNDIIHDCYFDVDNVKFDPGIAVVSFRFHRPASNPSLSDFVAGDTASPTRAWYLRIHHVESYSVNDTKKVGTYDFNILDYNTSTRCITVLTNVPIDMRIVVRDFEISLELAYQAG